MIGRPVNPNSARQQRIRAAQGRQKLHGRPKLATDNGRLVIPPGLIDAIQASAKERRKTRADHPELNPFRVNPTQLHPPGSRPPKEVQMAMDQALGWAGDQWTNGGLLGQVFAEGLAFPGYPYLSELAQRPEYRTAGEIISTEMTRKWIQFSGKGTAHQQRQRDRKMAEDFGLPDPHAEQREEDEAPDSSEKQEKIAQLEEFLDNLNCRGAYRLLEATDCYFGRAHLFHEIDGNDGSSSQGSEKLQSDIGLGIGDISQGKVSRRSPLTRLTNVEPVWIYPTTYNAMNPLVKDFYNPSVWYMQGIPVHCSRMFTQIGRPVPDLLKPAYSFGGLSLSQIMQPYVNIWLETRESIGRLIHAFSVMVLSTDLQTLMQPGGGALMERINLFNTLRDNNGCFVINKNTEDFKNISVPLGGLHELQAQSQEHMASIIRVPVAIYTGISPTGLNASSEGEIRIFENNIHAAQESRYRQNLTKTINFAQLSLWDEIDPDITFEFVQLRELTEKEEAELRKLDAETDDILMNGCQAISPEEVRIRVAGDDNGPHAGIDPDDLPEPPQPPPGEGGPGAEGTAKPGEEPGEPKPGGRINVSGREEYTGVGDAEFKEGDHPRAPDGKFGGGGGSSHKAGNVSFSDSISDDAEIDRDQEHGDYLYDVAYTPEHDAVVMNIRVVGDVEGALPAASKLNKMQMRRLQKEIAETEKGHLEDRADESAEAERWDSLSEEQQNHEIAEQEKRDAEAEAEHTRKVNASVDAALARGWRPEFNRHGGYERPPELREWASPKSAQKILARLKEKLGGG